jgi:hypothetical protein
MTTKFDHIKLSRAFRPVALSTLKASTAWPSYMTAKGYDKRSEDLTKPEIHEAYEALGLDLQGLYDGFHASPANAAVVAHILANGEHDDDEPRAVVDNLAEDARIEAMLASAPTPVVVDGVASFEGLNVDDVLAEALAPASPHMTPHLAGMMPGLLRPLVEAATRGPRVVEKTLTVTVDDTGAAIVPAFVAPNVHVKRKVALHAAFGMPKSAAPSAYRWAFENIMVDVCDAVDAPDVDDDYIWPIDALCEIASQDVAGLNAWLYGPAGIGKTKGAEQYAARLQRPFFRIAIDRTTEPSELIGQEVPAKGGGMKWSDGKLTRAFRVPHAVVLIDEPTLLRSGTLAMLQTALDHRALYLTTGEIVRAAPGVFIIAADNTSGCGDDTGRYVDTSPVNAAFLDRFALKTLMTALSAGQETTMVAARCNIPSAAARIMVEFANATRAKADSGHLTMGVTPRRLMAWGKVVKTGIPSAKAWHSVVVTGAAPEDREPLIMLESVDLRGKHATIDGLVRGTINPNAPVVDHTQGNVGATALQFPDATPDMIDPNA